MFKILDLHVPTNFPCFLSAPLLCMIHLQQPTDGCLASSALLPSVKYSAKCMSEGPKTKTKTSNKGFRMSRVQWTKKVPKVEWRNLKSSSNEEPHSRSMHSWRKAFKYTCFSLLNTWPTVEILKSSGFALVKWAIRQSNRWRKKVVNYTSKVRLR